MTYRTKTMLAACLSVSLSAVAFGQPAADPVVPPAAPMPTSPSTPMPAEPAMPVTPPAMQHTDDPAMSTPMQTHDTQRGPMGEDMGKSQFDKIATMGDHIGDGVFVHEAACGNLWEVEFAKLAQRKAPDQAVKDLAAMIVTDHTEANENLRPIAEKMGLDIPTDLPAEKQAMLSALGAMSDDQFEVAYLVMMKADHAKDITLFSDHEKGAKDDELKKYIAMVLPKLEEHGGQVGRLAASLGYATPMAGMRGPGMAGGVAGSAGTPGAAGTGTGNGTNTAVGPNDAPVGTDQTRTNTGGNADTGTPAGNVTGIGTDTGATGTGTTGTGTNNSGNGRATGARAPERRDPVEAGRVGLAAEADSILP